MIFKDFEIFLGIFRWDARPLPDPIGIIPKITLVFTKQEATSLIVPSPPQATITLAFSAIDSFAKVTACLENSDFFTTTSKRSLPKYFAIAWADSLFLPEPEIGLIMK